MTRRLILAAFVLALAYLLFWPVPVTPVAWDAPKNAGFKGAFARNERLKGLEQLPIGANHGPGNDRRRRKRTAVHGDS